MNRRRILSSIHRDIARKPINAVAWFNAQSFHQSAEAMPFEQIPMKELDKAGAALLPKPESKRCIYCGGELDADTYSPFCSTTCAIDAENS